MTDQSATNPGPGEDVHVEDQPGVENEDLSLEDQEGQTEGQPEDEDEEVEHDGQKYRVHKALKPALMMHADYTKKTQDLAQDRRAFETEREESRKSDGERVRAYAEVVAMDQALAQWANVDWDAYQAQDPQGAMRDWRRFQELKDARTSKAGELQQKEQQRALESQRDLAKRVEQSGAVLARDIPGWNEQLVKDLDAYGGKLGFTPEERFRLSADPRIVKLLHSAFATEQSKSRAQTTQQLQQKTAVKPAASVSGGSARAQASGMSDRSSIDDWMKARNEQVRKRS